MIASREEPDTAGLIEGISAQPEAFYRAVLDSLCEGVLITDAARRIRYASRRITDITGYEASELTGRTVNEVFLPQSLGPVETCTASDPDSEEQQCLEVEIRCKDGRPHWVYLQTTP